MAYDLEGAKPTSFRVAGNDMDCPVLLSSFSLKVVQTATKTVSAFMVNLVPLRKRPVLLDVQRSVGLHFAPGKGHSWVSILLNVARPQITFTNANGVFHDPVTQRSAHIFSQRPKKLAPALHFVMTGTKALFDSLAVTAVKFTHGASDALV